MREVNGTLAQIVPVLTRIDATFASTSYAAGLAAIALR